MWIVRPIIFACLYLDINFELFEKLKPHHIKELVPNLSERIKFEDLYEQYKKGGHVPFYDCSSSKLNDSDELTLVENEPQLAINVDNICAQQIQRCIVYQNLNVKTAQDITSIQSIDLKIVIKNYNDKPESLQSHERLTVARANVHHLLVSNLECKTILNSNNYFSLFIF